MNKLMTICALIILLLATTISFANEGSVSVKFGYVIPDETDHLGVNQETYNLYEGLGLSFNNLRYRFDNGLIINGDLTNITLNNRNLRMNVQKPKMFSLSFYNNQYRRTYDADGVNFTRRISTGLSGQITAIKNFKLFGGFSSIDKDGTVQNEYRPVVDVVTYKTDYTQYMYNFGAEGFCEYGRVRAEFKHHLFEDDIDYNNDRKTDIFSLSAFTSVPGNRNYTLAGGLVTREDDLYDRSSNLKTNSFWGAAKFYFKKQITFNYRLVNSKFEHADEGLETTHMQHTISLSKAWQNTGGLTAGYEYRTADNETDKTKATGYLISGWYNFNKNWRARGKYSFIGKEVDEGTTLVGDEDRSRHMISLRYKNDSFGSLEGKLEKRIKKYEEIDSKVDYTALSTRAVLKQADYGKLSVMYSYYKGEYENRSDDVSYDFKDHVVNVAIYPVALKKARFKIGGTYYRHASELDIDLEKFSADFGLTLTLPSGYALEGTYKMYTYDDYLIANNTYTANVIEINFIKDIQF